MDIREIGNRLVTLCNANQAETAVRELYGPDIVSIEAQGSDEMPARMVGLDAIQQKNEWWFANHEVHGMHAAGPFVGHRDDQFAVHFEIDVTPKGGSRFQMTEVALYTVRDGRIVQEEFLYHA
jgi:ketosteroid isomerase-like protein